MRTFKPYENRGLILSLAAASLLLGLVGCGANSSDPTAQYADLNATVAPHKDAARPQAFLDRSYTITPEENVTFVEGETKSFFVRVQIQFTSITSYDLKVTGIKNAVVAATEEPGKFKVSWNVPRGTIPTDQQSVEVPYVVEIINAKGTDAKSEQIFAQLYKVREFKVSVVRTGQSPKFVDSKVSGLSEEVKQGAITPFTITIEDPASYEDLRPKVEASIEAGDDAAKAYFATGAVYARIDNLSTKFKGNGRWTVSGFLMAGKNEAGIQQGEVTSFQGRMTLKITGVTGVSSKALEVGVKIKAEPAPKVEAAAPAVAKESAPAVVKKEAKASVKSAKATSKKSPAKKSKTETKTDVKAEAKSDKTTATPVADQQPAASAAAQPAN